MKKIILLLGFFVVAGTATAQTCETPTTVYGNVYLDSDANPIENATVIAWVNVAVEVSPGIYIDFLYYLGSDITNSTGDYLISLNLSYLPSNRVYIEAHKYGALKNKTGEFSVPCGSAVPKNITYITCGLSPPPMAGHVKHNGAFINETINVTAYFDGSFAGNYTLSDPTKKYDIKLNASLVTTTGLESFLMLFSSPF